MWNDASYLPYKEIQTDVDGHALGHVPVLPVEYDGHSEGDDLGDGQQHGKQPYKSDSDLG